MLFLTRLTSLLPLWLNRRLGTLLGKLLYQFKSKPYRITRSNLQFCFPELDEKSLSELSRNSLIETGKLLTENGIIFLQDGKKVLNKIQNIYGLEHLEAARKKGNGTVLAVPHLGCWELLILFLSNQFETTVLYRPLASESFDRLVLNARQRLGAKLVPTDNTGVRALFKAMKNNEIAMILPDHEPKFGGGIFSSFFNQPAYSSTLIPKLASKTNAEVLLAFAERLESSKGYNIHIQPMPSMADQNTESATETLNHSMEQLIRQKPEQYLWIYRRFRTRPEGEKSIY